MKQPSVTCSRVFDFQVPTLEEAFACSMSGACSAGSICEVFGCDPEKCAGVQTYSSTIAHACAGTQVKGSKQSVHGRTVPSNDDSGTLTSRLRERVGDEPVEVQGLVDSVDESEKEIISAIETLKSDGVFFEPEKGKVQKL